MFSFVFWHVETISQGSSSARNTSKECFAREES
jgi:hypothetical protein